MEQTSRLGKWNERDNNNNNNNNNGIILFGAENVPFSNYRRSIAFFSCLQ
jgi:hypothetical protein